jgi:hypothetical protein
MNTKAQGILIAAAAIVLAAMGYLWWVNTHQRVWVDRQVPIEGEASYNDYYVIQQALRAMNVRVQSMPHLPDGLARWNADDSLLLGSDPKTLSPDQQHALLDWVGRGGRLLVTTDLDQPSDGTGFLDAIGVAPGRQTNCVHWKSADKPASVHCFRTFAMQPAERENFHDTVGDDTQGWLVARRTWGLGSIEVTGDLQVLQNRWLDSPQQIDWAWQLIAPVVGTGIFHIVYQTELPPLYVYLVRYGWYALLPLLIALLGWLWARAQRFGPPMVLPEADRRALGEHIMASGEYLYRRGLVAALHAPLRRRFDDQLRRRDPELSALPVEELARTLAQRRKLPLASVQNALRTPQARQPKAFLHAVQTLLQMLSSH